MKKQPDTLSDILNDQINKVLHGNIAPIHFHTTYSNAFCCMVNESLNKLDFKYNLMCYQLKSSEIREPYQPFLSLIQAFIYKNNIDIKKLLRRANVYPAHKSLFEDYFRKVLPNRKEEIIFGYQEYEATQIKNSIAKIITQLSKETPLIIAIADLHFADSCTLQFILSLKKYLNRCKILFLFCYNKNYHFTDDLENDKWSSYVNHVEVSNFIINLDTYVYNKNCESNWPSSKIYNSIEEMILASLLNLRFLDFGEAIKCALKAKNILENNPTINIKHYLTILQVLGDSFYYLGENDNAIAYYRMLLQEAHKRNDTKLLSEAYRKTALAHINKHDIETASMLANQSLKLAQLDNNEYQILKVYFLLYLISDKTNYPLEKDKYFLLLDLLLKYKLESTYAFCLKDAIMYLNYYPNLDEVHSMCDKGIKISLKNHNEYALALDYHKKAGFYTYSEDYENTMNCYKKSKKIRLKLGYPLQISHTYNGIGYTCMLIEDYKNAYRNFSRSIKLLGQIHDYNEICATLSNLALLRFLCRNYKESLKIIDKLLQIMRTIRMTYLPYRSITDIYTLKALCHLKIGQQSKAFELVSMIKESSSVPLNTNYGFLYSILEGLLHACNHEDDLAIYYFKEAPKHLDTRNKSNKYLLPMYYLEYGLMLFSMDKESEANLILSKGLILCNEIRFNYHKNLIESVLEGNIQPLKSYSLPKTNINLDAIVELAKQEVILNKLYKKIREIDFINKLQELSSAYTNKAAIAEKYLDLIYINFPAEVACLQVLEDDKWICLASKSSTSVSDYNDNMHRVSKLINKNEPILLDLTHNNLNNDATDFKSIVNIPIIIDNVPKANLFLAVCKSENNFTRDDLNVLTISMKQVVIIFSKIDQELALLKMSRTDILTGLNNRQALQTALTDELLKMEHDDQQNNVLSLMFIDLDNFKYYNDTFGHNVGDLILTTFAGLLKKCFRKTDFISRFGGDEFVVILPKTDEMEAKLIAAGLLELLSESDNFKNIICETIGHSSDVPEDKSLSCSIGISSCSYKGLHNNSLNTLLLNADKALYKAKNLGKNTIFIY